jgi:FAD/FMN-containing dehydrogenase
MTATISRRSGLNDQRSRGRVSLPGDEAYAAAVAIWPKPAGPLPRAVVHCHDSEDVQYAIRMARECDLPLSVRGGGHDWAGRALGEGIVIDLTAMRNVTVDPVMLSARVAGGARACDVLAAADPLGLAAVTGSVGTVGMAGLTLGGGYGPLSGRFGLALDNLLAAEVVLADGRVVVASDENEPELLWALRGGGGNFGVVTGMLCRVHRLGGIWSGTLFFPLSETRAVLQGCAAITDASPDGLTVQVGCIAGPTGSQSVFVWPTWSGPPSEGERQMAPFLKLGTLIAGSLEEKSYLASATSFDSYLADGLATFMETCWVPSLGSGTIDAIIEAMETAISPGCAVITHEFKGAAARVPLQATAFGLRRDHVLIEILATTPGKGGEHGEERLHRDWARAAVRAFDPVALPGGYPNLLAPGEVARAALAYGPNAQRLANAKRLYDPDNLFRSAIPLPVATQSGRDAVRL